MLELYCYTKHCSVFFFCFLSVIESQVSIVIMAPNAATAFVSPRQKAYVHPPEHTEQKKVTVVVLMLEKYVDELKSQTYSDDGQSNTSSSVVDIPGEIQ